MASKIAERNAWYDMIRRCHDPDNCRYQFYGKVGIAVCQEWRDSFDAFLADVGPRPTSSHSLDRYPNQSGNYEPGNVRWATKFEQANNRRDNVLCEAFGERKTVGEWAKDARCLVDYDVLRIRIKRGWDHEKALTGKPRIRRKVARL